jgi:hypothetical protein
MSSHQNAERNRQQTIRSQSLGRITCNHTGDYLHCSGQGWVRKADFAWAGNKGQAQRLTKRFPLDRPATFAYMRRGNTAKTLQEAHDG